MTVHYQDATIQVTSTAIRIDGEVYPIRDLTYVWHQRGRPSVRIGARRVGRGVLILLLSIPPLVAAVCVLSLAYSAQERANWRLALIILAVGAVAAFALAPLVEIPLAWLDRSYDRGNRTQELWVQFRGDRVMLLRSGDELRFGQVYRAVQRAVERSEA
ncbi:DUF6232 family protein [Rhizomonospora bruguierae]|uniref:DUF6232 family protein n=1 Tax=Rhizomonospora bruguierae TaxID=1581705 RepID=UPI001BCEFC52|nr:DUF6232 family protein [Micromonospora sp. NBRC 107566]